MKGNHMRIVIATVFILLLTSCSAGYTWKDAYRHGSYIESLFMLDHDIEEKGEENLNQNDLAHLRSVINAMTKSYEHALTKNKSYNDGEQYMIYEKLLMVNNLLRCRFYGKEMSFFLDKYTTEKIYEDYIKFYYDAANSIVPTDSESLWKKASLYRRGLEVLDAYYDNDKSLFKLGLKKMVNNVDHNKDLERLYRKDLQNLYNQYNLQYMQLSAQELYDRGKNLSQREFYQCAASAFKQAGEVYQPIGIYKDSQKLATYYDNLFHRSGAAPMTNGECVKIVQTTLKHSQYLQKVKNNNDTKVCPAY